MSVVTNYKTMAKALKLLRDKNLVWSDDFEAIREPLADWLADEMRFSLYAADKAIAIAEAIIKDA